MIDTDRILKHIKSILRPVKRRINTMIYYGNKVKCNCCGHTFRTFRPLGFGEKPVGACWFCDTHPRMRLLKDFLENSYTEIINGRKVLHIAPEIQIYQWLKNSEGTENYIVGDKHCEGYTYPADVIDLDITDIPFPDNSFDLVICNHVLEHVKEDIKAFHEIKRVLRPDGKAILLVPLDKDLPKTIEEPEGVTLSDEERIKLFGQFDHVRQYGLDYYDRLREAGLKPSIITPSMDKMSKLGLFSEEDIIICDKME